MSRRAYEEVIRNELRELSGEFRLTTEKVEELVIELSNNQNFLESISEAISDHLEDFGDNYGLIK